jgi:ADP-dependent phosphofructokinase/glucokinase
MGAVPAGSPVDEIVLGLGGTVDYEVAWDSRVVEELIGRHDIRGADLDAPGPIATERDLVVSMLALLRKGVGAERFVASSQVIEQFAARTDTRVTLGGTCVRAAIAMSAVGVPSTLHLVSMNDATRRLLPGDVDWINSASEDTTDPHLIVQYPQGARVRAGDIDVVAPHPNRLIYANDPPHRELRLSDQLGERVARARLFLISSLNVIQDRAVLDDRLQRLREHIRQMPADGVVMFEDAGYHAPGFAEVVRDTIAPLADVYSLNEDELQEYLGRTIDLLEPGEVAGAVEELATIVNVPAMVVHTKYWSLAYGPECGRYADALAGGNTMAATRYRCGDGFTAHDYDETTTLPPQQVGAELAGRVEQLLGRSVVCVPARDVRTPTPTTIGLGDTFVGGFVAALVRSTSPKVEAS